MTDQIHTALFNPATTGDLFPRIGSVWTIIFRMVVFALTSWTLLFIVL